MNNLNPEFTIDKKLKALQPHIDLKLYYNSIDYRRQIIGLFRQHEAALDTLKKEYNKADADNFDEEYDCVLGYN